MRLYPQAAAHDRVLKYDLNLPELRLHFRRHQERGWSPPEPPRANDSYRIVRMRWEAKSANPPPGGFFVKPKAV